MPSALGKKVRNAPPAESVTVPVVSGIKFQSPITYVKTIRPPKEVLQAETRIVKASADDLNIIQQCLRHIIHGGHLIQCHEEYGDINHRMKIEFGDVMNTKLLGKFNVHFGKAVDPTTM